MNNKVLLPLKKLDLTGRQKEKLLSGIGGFLGIIMIILISHWLLDEVTAVYIVPSMGASAVLLFAAPHAPMAQPWNLFGGHLVSAIVGVACMLWIPDIDIAAAAGVGLAISAMYYLKCIHPPGGATALAAVIGGAQIHDLGYLYILVPILLNTLVIFAVAVAFNWPFPKRRYPPFLIKKSIDPYSPIKHEDFVYALSQMDTFVDVTEEDLLKIYSLTTQPRKDD